MTDRERSRLRRSIGRLAREPIAQFLAAGAAIFLAYTLVTPEGLGGPPQLVTVPSGRVNQLVESFSSIAGRPPNGEELQALVEEFLAEEIAYREAVAMGLDADDPIIRRRLRQKLDFTLEAEGGVEEPSEADLRAWLADHADRYTRPERRALVQVLASIDRRGEAAEADVRAWLEEARAGADVVRRGDASLLPVAMPPTTREGVAVVFGDRFAGEVFAAGADGAWFGPIRSAFGLHIVRITAQDPPVLPEFDVLSETLRTDWIAERRRAARAEAVERMRARYEVRVDWPDGLGPADGGDR